VCFACLEQEGKGEYDRACFGKKDFIGSHKPSMTAKPASRQDWIAYLGVIIRRSLSARSVMADTPADSNRSQPNSSTVRLAVQVA